MTQMPETAVDAAFPEITVDLAARVFAALQPGLGEPVAVLDQTDATQAWRRVVKLAWDMPFARLSETLGRLEQGEGPEAQDALYAFTWGIYHSRAEDHIGDED